MGPGMFPNPAVALKSAVEDLLYGQLPFLHLGGGSREQSFLLHSGLWEGLSSAQAQVTRARTLVCAVWHLWERRALRLEDLVKCLRTASPQEGRESQADALASGRNTSDSIHSSRIASMTAPPSEAPSHAPPAKTRSADLSSMVAASAASATSVLTIDSEQSTHGKPKHGRSASVDFWAKRVGSGNDIREAALVAAAAAAAKAQAAGGAGGHKRAASSAAEGSRLAQGQGGVWKARSRTNDTEVSEAGRSYGDSEHFADPLQVGRHLALWGPGGWGLGPGLVLWAVGAGAAWRAAARSPATPPTRPAGAAGQAGPAGARLRPGRVQRVRAGPVAGHPRPPLLDPAGAGRARVQHQVRLPLQPAPAAQRPRAQQLVSDTRLLLRAGPPPSGWR
jgi:hypothetical protein